MDGWLVGLVIYLSEDRVTWSYTSDFQKLYFGCYAIFWFDVTKLLGKAKP